MSNETTIVGPYTLDLSGHWVMTNIGIYREVEHFDLPSQAKIVCEELNTSYRAGQASREQWIPMIKEVDPPQNEEMLVFFRDCSIPSTAQWCRQNEKGDLGWLISWEDRNNGPVTHYMPLPSPPNK